MAAGIEVTAKLDPADLAALGQAAKNAGKTIQREFLAGLKTATKPLGRRMVQEVAPDLPHGLAYRVAAVLPTVTARAAAGGAEVALNFRKPRVLREIEAGHIPHPVFGRSDRPRGQWTWDNTQTIEPGKVTAAFERNVRSADAAMLKVMDKVARDLGFR